MLTEIDLYRPKTLEEALDLLAAHAPEGKPLAGGTNLVVELRDRRHQGKALIDLSCIQALRGIAEQEDFVIIGGGTTLTDLLYHPLIARHAPSLQESAAVFANPLVRNRATVAGNLVDASPAADTAPPLLALDAEVQLTCQTASRWVALDDFLVGVRKTLIRPDEILTSVRWKMPGPRSAGYYAKVGLRKADAISVLSAAVQVTLDEQACCSRVRIALGAVAPRPFRAHAAEEFLLNLPLTAENIAKAAHLAAESTRPISDIRASRQYRQRITGVTVRRLLTKVKESLFQ